MRTCSASAQRILELITLAQALLFSTSAMVQCVGVCVHVHVHVMHSVIGLVYDRGLLFPEVISQCSICLYKWWLTRVTDCCLVNSLPRLFGH